MKRYILVELDSDTPDRWNICVCASDPAWTAAHVHVRTADVTDWVTPGGNAAYLRSVAKWDE